MILGAYPGPGRRLVGPPAEPTAEPWEREEGVLCVSCPVCAFTFDSIHTSKDGGYSCPQCEFEALARRVAVLETALHGLDGPLAWLGEHYPKALREMPREHFRAIRDADAALSAAGAATTQRGKP